MTKGAKKLAKYRKKEKLSYDQFRRIYFKNVSSQAISYWERGLRKPNLDNALILEKLKIADLHDWI